MLNVAAFRRAAPYAVILAAAAYLYHVALAFDYERVPGRIGPDAWPRLLLLLLAAICAIAIGKSVFFPPPSALDDESHRAQAHGGAEEAGAEDEGLHLSAESHPRLAWAGIALTFGYLCAFEWIGFFCASVAYLFLLMYIGGFRRPVTALAIAVATALGFVFVFMKIVYVSLPLGRGPFLELSVIVMKTLGIH